MAHPMRRASGIQRINLSFNPKAPFPIRKHFQSSELVTYLKKLWQQISESSKIPIPLGSRPNVILKMKRDELYVHDFVLAAFSDNSSLWSRFLTTEGKTAQYVLDLGIHAPMLTAEAMRKVMQLLYEGTTSFTMILLPQLLDVAKFFAITEIKQKCGEYIIGYVESNPNMLLSYLQLSYSYDLQADIKDKLVSKAACAFSKFQSYNKDEELMNLSGDVVEALLSSDDLEVPDPVESKKFDFVLTWLKRNPKAASKHINSLINACRFDRLTREENLKCFGKARENGIEHLVRKHIMDADWKKTCDERGQPRKGDCPSPKRGDATDLSSERHGSTGNSREFNEKRDKHERKQQKFDMQRFRSQKSGKSWKMKKDQRSSPDKMESSVNMGANSGGSSAKLLTAKELNPTTPQTPPVVIQENFQKKKSKHRKPKRLRSNQLKDKFEKSLNAKPSSKMEKVVETFTKVLNKKGRRLLQNRLMDPNFSDTFRNAVKGTATTEFSKPVNASKNANMILERDQRLCTIPQSISSGFLYTPESKDYKSYLDVYCKFMSEVGPKPNKTIAKVVNGGKPLQLRQSIIHTKINEFGKREATAYEQKFSPTERKKSPKSKSEMNKLSLF